MRFSMSREERLKEALRDNLKRRKAQARGRAQPAEGEAGAGGGAKPVDPHPKDAEREPR
jgi:hypothetical protein